MKTVINTSPLIFLSRLDFLDGLKVYEKVFTTDTVIDEIRCGIEKGHSNGLPVMRLVEDGGIEVVKPGKKLAVGPGMKGLHAGEASILPLALEMDIEHVLVDDRAAILAAKYLRLTPRSTPYILVRNVKKGIIDKAQFREMMDKLITFRYYISPRLYMKILETADAL